MINNKNITIIIERVLNRIDPRLINHGHRVAYCMMKVLESLEYDQEYIRDITMVSLMHDIGAYKTEEIDQLMYFETDKVWEHSIYGYLFLKYLSPISSYDHILLFHHVTYQEIKDANIQHKQVIQLLYLIDRIDIYWHQDSTLENIDDFFSEHVGDKFSKESIDIFKVANEKYHLFEKVYLKQEELPLTAIYDNPYARDDLLLFLQMISFTIDFRSWYMLSHCITTTSISSFIAKQMDLDAQTKEKIYYGAMLHDIGKVSTPLEILNATGSLGLEDMQIMKDHVIVTSEILQDCLAQEVVDIASRHHERIDGSGYPLGLSKEELTIPQRIVMTADVFSALIGKRSYKSAYSKAMTVEIVQSLVLKGKLDYDIATVVIKNYGAMIKDIEENIKPIVEVYELINQEFENIQGKTSEKDRLFLV